MRYEFIVDYEYPAIALHVVDGDTVDVLVDLITQDIDLGFRIILHIHETFEQRIRLYGINTPERGKPGYQEATDKLAELVYGKPLTCRTIKPHEKYGRWLASIATPDCPNVADAMIAAGFGVPYYGIFA